MDFKLSEDQIAMRDAVFRMAERDLKPLLARCDTRTPMSKATYCEALQILSRSGLTAPRLSVANGGSSLSMLDYGIVFEQIPIRLALNLLAHEVCVTRISIEGSASQKARLLPDLIAGRKIGCTGSTEPDSGSDPRGIRTRLTEVDGVLYLTGRKAWITNASVCDVMIVTCIDARKRNDQRVIKVVVDRERCPFEAREIEAIGLTQGYLGEANFDGLIVAPDDLIVSDVGGTEALKQTWNVNRPLIGLQAVQIAQTAFDMALEYAKLRRTFGKVIAGHQLIQKSLSDMATSIEASRLLCYRALAMSDSNLPTEGAAAMAKRYAQNACERVVFEAMNIFGALGLARETSLEMLYRDIRMLSIPDGTNEVLALIHGRELTGIGAFRDAQPYRDGGGK